MSTRAWLTRRTASTHRRCSTHKRRSHNAFCAICTSETRAVVSCVHVALTAVCLRGDRYANSVRGMVEGARLPALRYATLVQSQPFVRSWDSRTVLCLNHFPPCCDQGYYLNNGTRDAGQNQASSEPDDGGRSSTRKQANQCTGQTAASSQSRVVASTRVLCSSGLDGPLTRGRNRVNNTCVLHSQRMMGVKAFRRVQRALARAPYETHILRTKGNCACLPRRCVRSRGVCVPRNKHEQLFWFGPRGPTFVVLAVQALLFLTALYDGRHCSRPTLGPRGRSCCMQVSLRCWHPRLSPETSR